MTRLAPRASAGRTYTKRPFLSAILVLFSITCRDVPTAPRQLNDASGLLANAGSGLTITPARDTILIGQNFTLTATNSNGTPLTKAATWTSSDTSVAAVVSTGMSTGRVTGRKTGTVTITAVSNSKSGTNTTTVIPVPVRSVTVAPDTASRERNDSAAYVATPKDSTGAPLTGRVITWATADTNIAAVSTTGMVRARARGTTQVSATSEGKTGTASFTVRVPQLTVSALSSADSANAGDSVRVVYTISNGWDDPNADSVIIRVGLRDAGGTVLFAVRRALPRVRAGASRTDTTQLSIAAASAAGSYAVIAFTDCADVAGVSNVARLASCIATPASAGSIAEGDETDNSRSAALVMRRPELSIPTLSAPDSLFTRTSVSATVSVANSGSPTPVGFDVLAGVYDVTISAFLTAAAVTTPALGSRQSRDVVLSISVPATANTAHSYEVRAWVDCRGSGAPLDRLAACFATPDTGAVAESNDGNNSAARSAGVASNIVLVAVQPDSVMLVALGDSATVAAHAYDRAAAEVSGVTFQWTSLDPAIATVAGRSGPGGAADVHAVANGIARVVAAVDGRADTTRVIVAQQVATVVTTPPSAALAAIGQTVQLSASASDRNGSAIAGASFTWTSLDPSVGSVGSSGLTTALAAGSARIVATSGGTADTSVVTISQTAARVSVKPHLITVDAIGDTAQLVAAVFDANENPIPGAQVTWTSLDPAFVTVAANGTVTAVANGVASVVASVGGNADTARVTVVQQVASVTCTPAAASLGALGETVQLAGAAHDRNGNVVSGATFTWTSLDAGIAAVSGAGLVTAVANGTGRIVISSASAADTTVITVTQLAARVTAAPRTVALAALGDTARFGATVYDANGSPIAGATVTWTAPEPAVATVSADGLVTAVANGAAHVIAAFETHADTVNVSVSQQVTSVAISPDSAVITSIGDSTTFNAAVRDANGNAVATSAAWSSLDPSIAGVSSSGTVTAIAAGSARIVASAGGHADTARVAVAQIAARVVIAPDSAVVTAIGRTAQFSAIAFDRNQYVVAQPTVTWYSINPSVARVDSTGKATTVAVGRASIVASVNGVTDTALVVSQRTVASVMATPDSALLTVGGTIALYGAALDADAAVIEDRPVSWTSANAGVATVTADGQVSAVSDGAALIIASRDGKADTVAIFVNPVGYTARWTGANGFNGLGSWTDPGNWMPHQVPDSTSNVYVPGGLASYPDVGDVEARSHALRVASGARVVGGDNSVLATYGDVAYFGTPSFGTLQTRGSGTLVGALPRLSIAREGATGPTVTLAGRTTASGVAIGGGQEGRLVIGGHTLQTTTLTVQWGGSLDQTSSMDSVIVIGDAQWTSNGGGNVRSNLSAGVLAIGGNFTSYGPDSMFATSGSHSVIFTGNGAHSIIATDTTGLFQNVFVSGTATINNTIGVKGRLRLLPGGRFTTLDQYNQSVHVSSALPETELGSYEVPLTFVVGAVTLNRNYIIPTRLFVDQGGSLTLNGHALDVLSLSTYNGAFTMNNPVDTMIVREYSQFWGVNTLSAGTYIAQGDVSVATAPQVPGSGWFVSGSHTMIFDGSVPQNISLGDSTTAVLQNVEVRNAQGVTLSNATVRGLMTLTPGARLLGNQFGALKFTSQLPQIGSGSYELTQTFITGAVTATQNARIPGSLFVDQGGSLTLGGHTVEAGAFGTYRGALTMNNPADTLVARDFAQFFGVENLSAGAMVVMGGNLNVSVEPSVPGAGWNVSGTHTTIFDGTQPIVVNFQDTVIANLNDVLVRNAGGVTFGGNTNIRGHMRLASGGRVLTSNNALLKFWTDLPDVSQGSYEVQITMVSGQVTAARNELLPTNLFVDGGGELRLGRHRVEVMYLSTYRGTLTMDSAADTLVARNGASFYGTENLSDGNLIVMGDLSVSREPSVGGAGWNLSGPHKITFAGAQPQMVSMQDSTVAVLRNADVTNSQGVIFGSSATVTGRLQLLGGGRVSTTNSAMLKFASELPRVSGGAYDVQLTLVTGNAVATSNEIFPGSVFVEQGGRLAVNGHRLDVGYFGTHYGSVTMNNAADTVIARQGAQFYGAADLSAGTLLLLGDLTVSNVPGSPSGFVGGGTHTTVFAGTGVQTIDMPDDTMSTFGNLRIDNAAGVQFNDLLRVSGQLQGSGNGVLRSSYYSNAVHAAGLDVAGLVLDGVTVEVNGGTLSRFDNVTFQGMFAPALLRIRHPGTGGTFTMNNINFTMGSSPGSFWVDADDSDGDAPLTLDITSAQHADGPANTRTSNGAVVTWRAPVVGNY